MGDKGMKRSNSDFEGYYTLIYFGYTFCPDICPSALNNISLALDNLRPEYQKHIKFIFITIDPERDKLTKLRSYKYRFHSSLLILTGSIDSIRDVSNNYKVYFNLISD